MAKAFRIEKLDKLGNPIKRLKTPNPATHTHHKTQAKRPHIDTSVDVPVNVFIVTSSDDDDYDGTVKRT